MDIMKMYNVRINVFNLINQVFCCSLRSQSMIIKQSRSQKMIIDIPATTYLNSMRYAPITISPVGNITFPSFRDSSLPYFFSNSTGTSPI